MWLPTFPVHFAALSAGLFMPSGILADAATLAGVWIVLKVISIGLLILRIFSRLFSGTSSIPVSRRTTSTRPNPRFAPPAQASSHWTRFALVAVIVAGCGYVAWRFLLPQISPATANSAEMRSVQSVVASYMYSRATSPSSIQFLDWSDLQNSGADWLITVHYKAMQHSGEWTTATVRFTVHGGTVASAQVLPQG